MPAYADETAVEVRGGQSSYDFAVTIKSLDKGCHPYADWWEILSTEGKLLA